jgi:hypothetical protein
MTKKIWKDIFNEEVADLLECSLEETDQVVDMLVEDRIDPGIFLSNLEALLQTNTSPLTNMGSLNGKTTKQEASHSILHPPKSRSDIPFWSTISRPHGIPLWFLAAYPDVDVWFDEQQEKHYGNLDAGMIEFTKLFSLKKGKDIKDFEDSKGKIRVKYLKYLVQSFKNATKKGIETELIA